jgi:hypothetical protein
MCLGQQFFVSLWLLHNLMHSWKFVRILPTASMKMVKKKPDQRNIFFHKVNPLEIEFVESPFSTLKHKRVKGDM